MQDPIKVQLLSALPTPAGFAVFLKNGKKIGTIYVDPSIGLALPALAKGNANPRPFTHDLIHDMMSGMGITLRNACITSVKNGIFHARIIMQMENEVSGLKIIELDARSSDAMALTLRLSEPLYINRDVWDGLEDLSTHYDLLKSDSENNNLLDLS